jgi:hypothetical protein
MNSGRGAAGPKIQGGRDGAQRAKRANPGGPGAEPQEGLGGRNPPKLEDFFLFEG